MEQGSPEWFAARLGKATGSRIADIVAKTKSGYSASRANYAAQLVAERLTGVPQESYTNGAMQWGTEKEPEARAFYAARCFDDITEVGFVEHPSIGMSGASPDALVGPKGLVELKCPNTATHIDSLLGETIASKYIVQMQWQMACCEREWCDWVSYDPRLPEEMRLLVKRVERDDIHIMTLENEVRVFLAEVEDTVGKLTQKYKRAA